MFTSPYLTVLLCLNHIIPSVAVLYSCVVIQWLSMRRTTSAWLLPTSDKTLKQLLSYLLWWEKSLWPHYDQIRARNRAQSHSFFTPDRQSTGPSGDTNHITVFSETDVMIVQHNRLGLDFIFKDCSARTPQQWQLNNIKQCQGKWIIIHCYLG